MSRPGCGIGCGAGCARIGCWLMACGLLAAFGLGKLVIHRTNQGQIKDAQ